MSSSRGPKMARRNMKSYEFQTRADFYKFLDQEKAEMHTTIFESVDEAFAKGGETAYIAEIFLYEENTYIDLISSQEEWLESLELGLKYYTEIEEYLICAKIKKLIDSIKTKVNFSI
jgi:hypothetical protein